MREIKFRAWDKEHKKMRGHTDPQTIQAVLFGNDYNGRVVVMQYTGLHDKNGKEIYEGDIVKQIKDICIIKSCVGGFECKMVAGPQKESTFIFNYLSDKYCEVIGNIHDNPSLLEVQP